MQHTYLLDTNILLVALISPERLPEITQTHLVQPENRVYFSAASIWEIAIKASLNKVDFNFSPEQIHNLATTTGFAELPVFAEHTFELANMTWYHRDPFDRLLIAQARTLPATLLTTDLQLRSYSDLVQHIVLN